MNLEAMASYCKKRYRDPTNVVVAASSHSTQTDWPQYINEAYFDTLAEADWPLEEQSSTVNVSANASTAALPTGAFKVLAVFDPAHDIALEPVDSYAARASLSLETDTVTGIPERFWVSGTTLHVRPKASEAVAYTVWHRAAPAELSTGESPIIPAIYHRSAICSRALALAFHDDEKLDQSQAYDARFERAVANMRKELLGPRMGRYVQMPAYRLPTASRRR